MITFNCECGNQIRVAEDAAGKSGKCKKCGESISVPAVAKPRGIATVHPPLIFADPEPLVKKRKDSAAAHSLGIASLALGAIAFPICWVPLVGALGFPLSATGVALGVAGLIASVFRGGNGIGFPIAGIATCGVAVAVSGAMAWAVLDPAIQQARAAHERAMQKRDAAESPHSVKPAIPPVASPPVMANSAPVAVGELPKFRKYQFSWEVFSSGDAKFLIEKDNETTLVVLRSRHDSLSLRPGVAESLAPLLSRAEEFAKILKSTPGKSESMETGNWVVRFITTDTGSFFVAISENGRFSSLQMEKESAVDFAPYLRRASELCNLVERKIQLD